MDEYKYCAACRLSKSRVEFHKNKARSDGLTNYCKVCESSRRKTRRLKSLDKEKARSRKYYINHRSEILLRHKTYNANNKEKVDRYNKNWRITNRTVVASYYKKYRVERPEYYRARDLLSGLKKRLKLCGGYNPTSFKSGTTQILLEAIQTLPKHCIRCNTIENLSIHHIVPMKLDLSKALDPSNFTTLCIPCNSQIGCKEIYPSQ